MKNDTKHLLGDNIYTLGGYDNKHHRILMGEVYNSITKTWRTFFVPSGSWGGNVSTTDDSLLLGCSNLGFPARVYKPSTGFWQEQGDGPIIKEHPFASIYDKAAGCLMLIGGQGKSISLVCQPFQLNQWINHPINLPPLLRHYCY